MKAAAYAWLLWALVYACAAPAQPSTGSGDTTIVAILADPDSASDSYLDAAFDYYRAAGVEPIRVSSLTALHNRLVQQVEAHGPLRKVILVAHGSTWTGASVDLFPAGSRASVSTMRRARRSGVFPALPEGSIDQLTQFRLESCAVGRHSAWVRAFAALWVAPGQPPPEVLASTDFVAFGIALGADSGVQLQKLSLPVAVHVTAGRASVNEATSERTEGESCAPIASPCERRSLPIRVEVDLDASVSARPFAARRRLAQKLARPQLVDLNLRPEQLDWDWEDSAQSGWQRWRGMATAIITTPLIDD